MLSQEVSMLRYRCLVLDHDDTTVDSTRSINYPQFCQALSHFRPGMTMSEEEYFLHCFDPGFYGMCQQVLHYTPEEMAQHLQMWKDYHKNHYPPFFPGIPELIRRHKAQGGLICVVSHSTRDVIEACYEHAGVPLPDLIFGAEQPTDRCKPSPWPMEQIISRFSLRPQEILMVDDMPQGGQMARAVGVAFACAGWYGMLPQIEASMRKNCDIFFSTVEEFSRFLFEEDTTP